MDNRFYPFIKYGKRNKVNFSFDVSGFLKNHYNLLKELKLPEYDHVVAITANSAELGNLLSPNCIILKCTETVSLPKRILIVKDIITDGEFVKAAFNRIEGNIVGVLTVVKCMTVDFLVPYYYVIDMEDL